MLWGLAGLAIAAVAVLFIVALLGPVTDLIARHDVAALAGSQRASHLQAARETARTQLLTLGAGIFAAGALWFTARNYSLSRESQVTDRYTKAIEQLGSDRLEVRIGGIYALERIAHDSARDHPTVIEVLAAFIREHSREHWALLESHDIPAAERSTPQDVQSALTVVGRRIVKRDRRGIDLANSALPGASFLGANLAGAVLDGADLTAVFCGLTDFTGAWLRGAKLAGADLRNTYLTDAHLDGADLTHARLGGANLGGTDLTGADLTGADLNNAYLVQADLTDACLIDADLTSAHLAEADLTGTDFTGAVFDRAHLTRVEPIRSVRGGRILLFRDDDPGELPDGWMRDPDSGHLVRADHRVGDEPTD